ncbi:MAG: hypothetical protein M1836_003673 [Candelina mexicana]|nr:MAG: hypothetical protein M1836_003673 [Candelina mexicana]
MVRLRTFSNRRGSSLILARRNPTNASSSLNQLDSASQTSNLTTPNTRMTSVPMFPECPMSSASEAALEPVVESPETDLLTGLDNNNTQENAGTLTASTSIPKDDFNGAIIINYTPDTDLNEEWNDGFGPSLRKVLQVTQALLKGDKDEAGLKLARVIKVTIMGRWDSKYATSQTAEAQENEETGATGVDGKVKEASDPSNDFIDDKGSDHNDGCKVKPLTKEELYENATAIARIAETVYLMSNLETFEWKGELPFAREMWRAIRPGKLKAMYLDLWRPGVTRDETAGDILPIEDMRPLRQYVHVKDLSIVGMLDSYQPMIWEAAWVMKKLVRLDLRMALEPVLRRGNEWPFIQNRWKMRKLEEVGRGYQWVLRRPTPSMDLADLCPSGDKGSGVINYQLGYGEYLDPLAIMKARRVMCPVVDKEHDKYIHLEYLALAGFVVDAQPFIKAFCPGCLKHLEIVHDCIDAGLAMPEQMLANLQLSIPSTKTGTEVRITKYTPCGRESYDPARHVPDDQIDQTQMYTLYYVGSDIVHREPAGGILDVIQVVQDARANLQNSESRNQGRLGGQVHQSRRGRRGGLWSGR